jgi:RecA-family ATPase
MAETYWVSEAPEVAEYDEEAVQRRFLDALNAREAERRVRALDQLAPEGQMLSVADLLALPPAEWLIEGVLVEESMAVLFGQPGSYKSFVALDWACSIALGRDWQGRSVGPPRRVVYLAAEGLRGLQKRLRAWASAAGVAVENLQDKIDFYDSPVDLLDRQQVQQLINVIDEGPPAGLVVIDTLARCMPGADENSSQAMGLAVASAQRLKGDDGAVLLVHHSPKDQSNATMRGSSALHGAADTGWMTKVNGEVVTLLCVKQKDEVEGEPVSLQVQQSGPSAVLVPAGLGALRSAVVGRQDDVLAKITEQPGITRAELSRALDVSTTTLRRDVDALERMHLIEVRTEGNRVRHFPAEGPSS